MQRRTIESIRRRIEGSWRSTGKLTEGEIREASAHLVIAFLSNGLVQICWDDPNWMAR